eukprot:scaffold221840_cov31-Tisochrysis_lutea.AAC.2
MDRPESHVFIVDGRSLSTCGQICFFALRCLHDGEAALSSNEKKHCLCLAVIHCTRIARNPTCPFVYSRLSKLQVAQIRKWCAGYNGDALRTPHRAPTSLPGVASLTLTTCLLACAGSTEPDPDPIR